MVCSILVIAFLFLFVCGTQAFHRASYGIPRSRPPAALHSSPKVAPAHRSKKFIIVTGGVLSGIGKGVAASSVGVVLKMLGKKVTAIKIDPYLNVDAGTMSPYEHGEVFVLDDGGETDLDLGNYERFLDVCLTSDCNLTTGKIYKSVIEEERRGEYLGKTVQIIPHITNNIIQRILDLSVTPTRASSAAPDVVLIEMGGTIGDIESMPFVEAVRQLQCILGRESVCFVHVSLVPTVGGESKTKPTQHSVKELRSLGLTPDFIFCRSPRLLEDGVREKIELFCMGGEGGIGLNVDAAEDGESSAGTGRVFSLFDVPNVYQVPLLLLQQQFHSAIQQRLWGAETRREISDGSSSHKGVPLSWNEDLKNDWASLTKRMDVAQQDVKIALVGKYIANQDAYLSVIEALKHACMACGVKLNLVFIDSTELEGESDEPVQLLLGCDGILVPGGFGNRGIEGKIKAVQLARNSCKPYLGICLGLQVAVIEYLRHVVGRENAHSEEFITDLSAHDQAVVYMPEVSKDQMGGTMRLGARTTLLAQDTLAFALYGNERAVNERHRHRYEVNPTLVPLLEQSGLVFSGRDEQGDRMEVAELPSSIHPFFLATQFHPEFKSRPMRPSPPFLGFIQAAKREKERIK